jgi:lysyl-tRNA synthetase class 2
MIRKQVSWWPGSVKTKGGLHLHHLVFGIVLLLVCGFLGFALAPESPWEEILAALFGVGAGLTLDEFALWVHLEDVYWAQEGRASLDAVVVATLLGGLIVLGLAPFDLSGQTSSEISLVIAVLFALLFSTLAILKGKPILGLVGLFVPLFSIIGSARLATPSSPWARRRYDPEGARMKRSRSRYERVQRRRLRARNAIAGAPNLPSAKRPT